MRCLYRDLLVGVVVDLRGGDPLTIAAVLFFFFFFFFLRRKALQARGLCFLEEHSVLNSPQGPGIMTRNTSENHLRTCVYSSTAVGEGEVRG